MHIVVAAVVALVLVPWAYAQEPSSPPAADPKILSQFAEEHAAAAAAPRPVFEKYIPVLGASVLLDFLEKRDSSCYGQSRELGKALFAVHRDLGAALRDCGTRCTSGCMHGAVSEAFARSSPHAIVSRMNAICREGDMARIHKPGSCAHALGHALLSANGGDVTGSVNDCLRFEGEAMQYYCATGVFMAKIVTGPKENRAPSSPHAPCDSERLFPTACYRYKAAEILLKSKDHRVVTRACLELEGRQRLGCFHGLGYALTHAILDKPELLARVCAHGSPSERIVCVEGAVEKLAELDEKRANAACLPLEGKVREACDAAVARKMYGTGRPDWDLYYDRAAVAARLPKEKGETGAAKQLPPH